MNIEPGCMAITVSHFPENRGHIVRVLRKYGEPGCKLPCGRVSTKHHGPIWEIDKPIRWGDEGIIHYLADERCLQRINPDNETISWNECVFNPHKVIA